MNYRRLLIWFPLFLIVLFVVLPAGCGSQSRYEILNFFFDGVPEPGSEIDGILLDNKGLPKRGHTQNSNETQAGSRHAATNDCKNCHKGEMKWGKLQFKAPVPRLCYECHTNYSLTSMNLHGPVAVGACLFCHNPHRTKHPRLLKQTLPELCYLCHTQVSIKAITDHQREDYSDCLRCHDPHISSVKALLKPGRTPVDDPNQLY